MNAQRPALGLLLPSWDQAMDGATPRAGEVVDLALLAERVGYDSVWVADHFFYEPYADFRVVGVEFPDEFAGEKSGAWECWSLVAAIAQASSRVTIGTLVSNLGLRNPALFARQIDTVDDLADGRLLLGLGAGDFETEHRAYGFPFERRIGRFEEALGIVLPMLRGETVTMNGEFHRAEAAQLIPKGIRANRPPVMIGTLAGRPRMSRLVVQHAAMWNCMLAFGQSTVAAFEAAWTPIARACDKFDRDPATLLRHATIGVNLTDGDYPVPGATPLAGGAEAIADDIRALARAGADHVSIMPHPWTAAGIEQFGEIIERLND